MRLGDMLGIGAIGCVFVAWFIIAITNANAHANSVIEEIEQVNAKYYTSEVVSVDIERNLIVLDNGAVLHVDDISPTIGDIIRYGQTDPYDSTLIPNKIFKTGHIKHISKEIIGNTLTE